MLASFARWTKDAKSLLDQAEAWRGWSLYRLAGLKSWTAGPVTLLGDAAHPVLPYLAQGAGLAIEDAAALAACLAAEPSDPVSAFRRYERVCTWSRLHAGQFYLPDKEFRLFCYLKTFQLACV